MTTPETPTTGRLSPVTSIVVIAVFVLAIGGAALFAIRSGDDATNPGSPRPSTPGEETGDEPDLPSVWSRFDAPDGSFSLTLPTRPDTQVDETASDTTDAITTHRSVQGNTVFSISYSDFVGGVNLSDPDSILGTAVDGSVSATNGRIIKENPTTFGPWRAIDFEILVEDVPNDEFDRLHVTATVMLVGRRLYIMTVTSPATGSPGFLRMRSSFELNDPDVPEDQRAALRGEGEWVEFEDPEGKFSVEFPVEPETQSNNVRQDDGVLSVTFHNAQVGAAVFSLGYTDYPSSVDLSEPRKNLDNAAKGAQNEVGGRLLSATSGDFLGFPSLDFVIEVPDDQLVLSVTAFVADRRMYFLQVGGPTEAPEGFQRLRDSLDFK